MALNIKDPATDQLARDLAATTGESITRAVHVAMQERLQRLRGQADRAARAHDLHRFIERGRARETLDARTASEILGFDEQGLPS